jgi:flagellar basal body-associated protein FliL
MTNHSNWLMLAVVVVTFIAGYAVVSFAVKKFKEGTQRPPSDAQDQRQPDPTNEDRWR